MGRKIKLGEAKRAGADHAVRAVLTAHSRRDAPASAIVQYGDFPPSYCEIIEHYRAYALRAPEDWRCRLKSRSAERRFLDLVNFTFARYPVPAHLQRVWIDNFTSDLVDDAAPCATRVLRHRPPSRPDLVLWYLIATQGGSLHRQAAHGYLSKQEAHHFLNAPPPLTTCQEAFWYAIACAQGGDRPAAIKVAQSKLLEYSIASVFWKEVGRFFARNPTAVPAMNDLVDYLAAAKVEDPDFSLKGRTLATLQRRKDDWHRALAKQQVICGGAWAGRAIPDLDYVVGRDAKKAIWRFRQIKSGNDLYREGQRMHHCVASYKYACQNGSVSIWSLTSEFPLGRVNKGVTVEVRKDGAIVQCRGFANRLPFGNEVVMVKRWANEHRLTWNALER